MARGPHTEGNTYSSGSEANAWSFYVVRAQLYVKLRGHGGNYPTLCAVSLCSKQGATTTRSLGRLKMQSSEQALPQITHPRRSSGVLTPPVYFDESQLHRSGLRLTAAPRCPFCRLVREESRRARLERSVTRPGERPSKVVTRSPRPARIDTGSAHMPAWRMVLSYDGAGTHCPLKI